jgi:hypothetical protein
MIILGMKQKILLLLIYLTMHGSSFPPLVIESLNKQTIRLPNANHPLLLILGFDMKSAEPMEQWVRALPNMPVIDWVQVPVVGKVPPFVDGFIKKGMKKSVPDHLHTQFAPYFGPNKNDILRAIQSTADLEDNVTPFLVIVAPNGTILFSMQAKASTANINTLSNAITPIVKPANKQGGYSPLKSPRAN